FITIQASNRGGQKSGSRILQPDFYDLEEDWRPQFGSRPEIVFQMCRGKELKDGYPDVEMPYDPPNRLYDFPGFGGCIHVHSYSQAVHEIPQIFVVRQDIPVSGASIWAVAKSSHFYQGAQTGPDMGTRPGNQSLCVSRRPTNTWVIEGGMHLQHDIGLFQADRVGVQDQREEIFFRPSQTTTHLGMNINTRDMALKVPTSKNVEAPGEFHRKSPVYVGCTSAGPPGAEEALRIEVQFSVEVEMLGRQVVGDFSWIQLLLKRMETLGGIDAYEFQRAINDLKCSASSECIRTFGPDIFGQHYLSGICQEIWRYYANQIAGNIGADLVTLPKDQHPPASIICPICSESSRFPEKADSPNRMASIKRVLRSPELSIRTPRCGPIRLTLEQGGGILQLVPRHQRQRDECTGLQLVRIMGAFDTNSHNSVVEICDLIPRPERIASEPVAIVTGDNGSTRAPKREIATHREKTLDLDGMADQRRALQEQGLSDIEINISVSNERCSKRRSRYYQLQQRFLNWRTCKNIKFAIFTPQIVNYLAEVYKDSILKVGTSELISRQY
ncbi:hypothetical protein AYI69_g8017, partial [Smittium culicis]